MIMKRLVIGIAALSILTSVSGATENNVEIPFIYSDKAVQCLALNIYHEARNESFAGRVAVADVTVNRMYDSRYPNTICGVVHQAKLSKWHLEQGREVPLRHMCQFSWYCDGKSDQPNDGDSWLKSKRLAQNFLTYGEFRGITEGATHYHATYVKPDWVNDRGMSMVGSIGEHIFYRWN